MKKSMKIEKVNEKPQRAPDSPRERQRPPESSREPQRAPESTREPQRASESPTKFREGLWPNQIQDVTASPTKHKNP